MALCPRCFRTAEANYCRLCGVALLKDELDIARLQRSRRTRRIGYYVVVGVLSVCVPVVANLLWGARVSGTINNLLTSAPAGDLRLSIGGKNVQADANGRYSFWGRPGSGYDVAVAAGDFLYLGPTALQTGAVLTETKFDLQVMPIPRLPGVYVYENQEFQLIRERTANYYALAYGGKGMRADGIAQSSDGRLAAWYIEPADAEDLPRVSPGATLLIWNRRAENGTPYFDGIAPMFARTRRVVGGAACGGWREAVVPEGWYIGLQSLDFDPYDIYCYAPVRSVYDRRSLDSLKISGRDDFVALRLDLAPGKYALTASGMNWDRNMSYGISFDAQGREKKVTKSIVAFEVTRELRPAKTEPTPEAGQETVKPIEEVDRRIPVEILDHEVAELPKRVSLSVFSHLISGGQRVDCSGVADCRRKIPETARVSVTPEVDFSVEFKKDKDQLYTVRVSHKRGKGRRCLLEPGEKPKHECEPPLSDTERQRDDPARNAYHKTEGEDAIPTLDELDTRYGIRGLQFGTDIRDIDAIMFFVEGCDFDDGDEKCYTRGGDDLSQWGTEAQVVWYYFFRHRLMSVLAVIKHGAEQAFLSKIQSVYGPGKPSSKPGGYSWEGKRVRISYEDNPVGGRVWVVSREIKSQQMAAHPQS